MYDDYDYDYDYDYNYDYDYEQEGNPVSSKIDPKFAFMETLSCYILIQPDITSIFNRLSSTLSTVDDFEIQFENDTLEEVVKMEDPLPYVNIRVISKKIDQKTGLQIGIVGKLKLLLLEEDNMEIEGKYNPQEYISIYWISSSYRGIGKILICLSLFIASHCYKHLILQSASGGRRQGKDQANLNRYYEQFGFSCIVEDTFHICRIRHKDIQHTLRHVCQIEDALTSI
jgi:hypothetical protein